MTYKEVYRLYKAAADNELETAIRNNTKDLGSLYRIEGKKGYVWTPNQGRLSLELLKHVIPYAKAVKEWEKDNPNPTGDVDLLFDPKTGKPIGYSWGNEDGVHTDASDEELINALLWSYISEGRAKEYGLLRKKAADLYRESTMSNIQRIAKAAFEKYAAPDKATFDVGAFDRAARMRLNNPLSRVENRIKDAPIGPALVHGGTLGLTVAGAGALGAAAPIGAAGGVGLSAIPPIGAVWHGLPQVLSFAGQDAVYGDHSQLPAGSRVNYDKGRIEYPRPTTRQIYDAYMHRPISEDVAKTLRTRQARFINKYPEAKVPATLTGFGGTYQLNTPNDVKK